MFRKFVRYTRFSAASYADSCPNPPYGATVANFFNVASTDTQGYLFRDDAAKELILALRGTSDIQDFIIDFTSKLTAYNSVGVSGCDGCQVSIRRLPFVGVADSNIAGPYWFPGGVELRFLRSYRCNQHSTDFPLK